MPRRRQQLDARREPQSQTAQQRNRHVRPQRMPRSSFARNFAKSLVQRRINRQRLVVFIEQVRHALLFVLRIKRVRGQLVNRDLLLVHFPLRQVHIAETPHPSVRPSRKSQRRVFTRQFAVPRREKLHVVQRIPIARGPRHQRNQQAQPHQQPGANQFHPIRRPPPLRHQHQSRRKQHQRSFRPHQSAKSHHDSGEQPWIRQKRRSTRHARPAHIRLQQHQNPERRQKYHQSLGEHHGRVIRRERAERRQTKSSK